jgi:hypothetical protein
MEPVRLAGLLLHLSGRVLRRPPPWNADDLLVLDIWTTVRDRLLAAGLPPTLIDDWLADVPTAREKVEAELARLLAADPDLARELEDRLRRLRPDAPLPAPEPPPLAQAPIAAPPPPAAQRLPPPAPPPAAWAPIPPPAASPPPPPRGGRGGLGAAVGGAVGAVLGGLGGLLRPRRPTAAPPPTGPSTVISPLRRRIVSTGVGTDRPLSRTLPPRTVLAADRAYRYWFTVDDEEAADRVDTGPGQLFPQLVAPPDTRLQVILFPFAGELVLDPAADTGELVIGADGRVTVARQPPGGPAEDRQRLWFRFRTPARPGTYRLRAGLYLGTRLLQSRVLEVRVGRVQRPTNRQRISSVTDYSVTEVLDARALADMRPPTVGVLVNDSPGTHDFRFVGADDSADPLTGTASLDAEALEALLGSARRALRTAAWGSAEEWREQFADRYAEPRSRTDVAADLVAMARAGYRIWHAMSHALAEAVEGQPADSGGRPRVQRLTALLLRSGAVELASRRSLRLAVPSALIYDYPLDSNRDRLTFCPAATTALDEGRDLAAEPCFDGRCPSYADLGVVCPGGFWGYRHEIGVPLDLGGEHPGAATELNPRIPGGNAPVFVVGTTTDAHFRDRLAHLSRLQELHVPMDWELGEQRDVVLELLRMSSPHVVYFLCHGVEKDGLPGLVVGDPDRPSAITPDNLAAYQIAWPLTRPLVVLNGCRTTALDPSRPINFVDTFLQDAHASGVLGTEISVFEPLACAFAEEVLARFVRDDVSLGRAVREARLTLLARGNPLGLAYVAYAPTELQMV